MRAKKTAEVLSLVDKNTSLYATGLIRYSLNDSGNGYHIEIEMCLPETKEIFFEFNSDRKIKVSCLPIADVRSQISDMTTAIDCDAQALGLSTKSVSSTIPLYSFKHDTVFYEAEILITIYLSEM